MPHFGIKLHNGGLEGIHVGDLNVDSVRPTRIRGIWGPRKGALEMCQIRRVDRSGRDTRVVPILVHVG